MKFGAIDIGTNAARLLIGEVVEDDGQSFVKKISYTRIPLRLGFEVFENGKISDFKVEEFQKSVQAFKLIADVFDVQELRACATSAMREAKNGEDVQKLIEKKTGVNIEIIGGAEEAALILSNFNLKGIDHKEPFVVIDVGGGSTEISIFKKGEVKASRSFRVGTIRMLTGRTNKNIWVKIEAWIRAYAKDTKNYKIYGTGGNINKIHKLLGKKSKETVTLEDLKDLYKSMNAMSAEKRIREFQLKPDRADVIVPAQEIYIHVLKGLGAKEVYVPKIGLSDGIIYTLHKKHKKKK